MIKTPKRELKANEKEAAKERNNSIAPNHFSTDKLRKEIEVSSETKPKKNLRESINEIME